MAKLKAEEKVNPQKKEAAQKKFEQPLSVSAPQDCLFRSGKTQGSQGKRVEKVMRC